MVKKLIILSCFYIILFFSNNISAEDICDIFWNELDKQTNKLELYEPSKVSFYSYGFDVKRTINPNHEDDRSPQSIEFLFEKNTDYNSMNDINPHPVLNDINRFIYEKIQIGSSNFCDRNNCDQRVKEFLEDDNYLIIDRSLFTPIWQSENEDEHFLNSNNFLPTSDWELTDNYFFIAPNTVFITQIDDKPIKEFTDQELIKIFYLANEEEVRKFRIQSIGKNTFNDEGLWVDEGYIDINIKTMISRYRPINFFFKFGNYLDIRTVDNEISFDYSLDTFWVEPKMNNIAKKISNEYMNGNGFYCSMDISELNDMSLIIFYPDFRIQNSKINNDTKLNNEDIRIKYSYYGDGYDVEGSTSHRSVVTLHKNLKLNNFPFDKQRFNFSFSDNSYDSSEILILNDPDTIIFFDAYNSFDNEWSADTKDLLKTEIWSELNRFYVPSVAVDITLERNPAYYIFKVISPVFVLLIVLFSSVFIPPRQLESKLTLTVVCFLALIAYIFVIDESVPKLPYMTLMDYFILISFIFAAIPNLYAIYEFNYFRKYEMQNIHAKKIALLLPTSYLFCVLMILIMNVNNFKMSTSSLLNLFKF